MSLESHYKSMQTLFVKGLITYPRSDSSSISENSQDSLILFAKNNQFNIKKNQTISDNVDNFAHEAPTLTPEGVNCLMAHEHSDYKATLGDQELVVLKSIGLLQAKGFVPKQKKALSFSQDVKNKLPKELHWITDIEWKNEKWDNNLINKMMRTQSAAASLPQEPKKNSSAAVYYSQEQSLFETMVKYELGTPSTKSANIKRVQKLNLYDDNFNFNQKGAGIVRRLAPEHTAMNLRASEMILESFITKQRLDTLAKNKKRLLEEESSFLAKKTIDEQRGKAARRLQENYDNLVRSQGTNFTLPVQEILGKKVTAELMPDVGVMAM